MLATEHETNGAPDHEAHQGLLENWSENERMRHIPSAEWMVRKLDEDVRRRINALWLPYSDLAASDPRHPAIEAGFRNVSRWLDRVSEVARRVRGNQHPPTELGARVQWSLSQAIGNLTGTDIETFGRRLPFQTFERSNAEPLWGAMQAFLRILQQVADLVREIDPGIDEKIYAPLVNLVEPMRREPIA